MAEPDWRLTNQEKYLKGAGLAWARYRAPSETWAHDHCAFCWAKFMEPGAGVADTLSEGYTTTVEHEHGARCHWICGTCFDDFAARFEWQLEPESD
jgi:hypothetical protein